MSTVNTEIILEQAARTDDNDTAYTFRLTNKQKEDFFALCEKHNLAPGKVMRALLSQFMASMQ